MYLFCELCHRQPSVESGRFHFSTCCHIFCRKCSTDSGACPVCGQTCRILQIHKTTLPDSAKEYLVPYKDKLLKLIKVNKFQMQKRNTFIVPNQQLIERYEQKKQKIKKLNETYESFKAVIREEEELIRKLCERKKMLKAKQLSRVASQGLLTWDRTTPRTAPPNTINSQCTTPRHIATGDFCTPSTGTAQPTIASSSASGFPELRKNSDSATMSGVKRLPQMHSSGSSGYRSMETSSDSLQAPAVSAATGKRIRSSVEDFMQQTNIDSATRESVYEQTFQNLADAIFPAKQTQIKVCHKNNVERGRNVLFD